MSHPTFDTQRHVLTIRSPFSSKNIQECHCGTQSCRGVLGPKPKKPAYEEKSLAATIVNGAKRKLAEAFSTRGGSSSSSPKKRKYGNSADAKVKNAMAQTQAAREKARAEAAAHAAQLASRKDRAANRSKVLSLTKRGAALRASRVALPTVKKTTSRHATFNIRKVSKTTADKRVVAAPAKGAKKGLRPNNPAAPPSPQRDATPGAEEETASESGSDDDSPNITPASLRSANRKKQQQQQAQTLLKQSKLPFKPLNLPSSSTSLSASNKSALPPKSNAEVDIMEVPDSEPEDRDMEDGDGGVNGHHGLVIKDLAAASKLKGKAHAAAPRSLNKTGSGVSKAVGRKAAVKAKVAKRS